MIGEQFEMRSPCEGCDGQLGYVDRRGTQDCVFCANCGRYGGYNKPRNEGKGGRKSTPSRKAIHQYWMTQQRDVAVTVFNQYDIGEPTCYCCGRWDPNATDDDQFTSFYDRCHIIDHAFGGTETVDNLILLCRSCHSTMPRIAPGTPLETVGKWIEAQRAVWTAQIALRGHRIAHEKDDAA